MKALIIEDELLLREQLALCLRQLSFAVDMAEDGTEGFYLARINEYDIILTDNMLPEKNGESICRDIRGIGKTMPILVLSVLGETWRKVDLLNAGADDYLTKPYSVDELYARVRALTRRPTQYLTDILRYGDVELDVRRQTVSKGGKHVHFTLKEFALLELLMRNVDTVVTRSVMAEHVWDMRSELCSNTIESHIAYLRKKIDTNPDERLIHTVSGRGYVFGTWYRG